MHPSVQPEQPPPLAHTPVRSVGLTSITSLRSWKASSNDFSAVSEEMLLAGLESMLVDVRDWADRARARAQPTLGEDCGDNRSHSGSPALWAKTLVEPMNEKLLPLHDAGPRLVAVEFRDRPRRWSSLPTLRAAAPPERQRRRAVTHRRRSVMTSAPPVFRRNFCVRPRATSKRS